MSTSRPPLHDSLYPVDSEDIYRTDEWWKSVVRYRYEEGGDHDEVAIYLWHRDDGWTRKNKYVVKTTEAWETDTTIVNQLWVNDAAHPADEEWPVSDYYDVGAGETVFQSDGWWKAILKIVEKGTYETEEIMVYLWQERDGDWRRRQKYTIKDPESWHEEATAVESVLDADTSVTTTDPDPSTAADTTQTTVSAADTGGTTAATHKRGVSEFDQLNRELDAHLSATASE